MRLGTPAGTWLWTLLQLPPTPTVGEIWVGGDSVADGYLGGPKAPTHTDDGLRAAIDIRHEHPGTGVLIFSQYVETNYATRLLAQGSAGVGYLLKERVANVAEFTDALERVAAGGTALDPEVVTQLAGAGRRTEELRALTDRERDVLTLMAEGRSNAAIAQQLHVSAGTVEKRVAAIFGKLDLPASEDHNRRVLAVIRMLH
jgi:DNA-binding NarL/FixJ family response regulator